MLMYWIVAIASFWLGFLWTYVNEGEVPIIPGLITWITVIYLVIEGVIRVLGK